MTKPRKKPAPVGRCEDCVYYDTDEDGVAECCLSLDEDEYYRALHNSHCPYFRFYDEYKSVQKQN